MSQCTIVANQDDSIIIKINDHEELINSLKQSKFEYVKDNKVVGKEIGLEYMNDNMLDYESLMLIDELYVEVCDTQDYSNCYKRLKDLLEEHPSDIWFDLVGTFNQRVIGKSRACFDAIAEGFLDVVMEVWAEIREEVDELP